MSRKKILTEFVPGRGYTKEDWDAVDSPEITDEQIALGPKTFAEAFPDLAESIKRSRGRPATGKAKQVVSIRLDQDVVEKLKATGKGWQTKVNDILRAAKL